MTSQVQDLSRVIGDIYDAAIDPQHWQKALASACAFIGGSSGVLFWHDAAREQSDVMHGYNENAEYTRLYFEKYVALNPVFPAAAFLEQGMVHTSDDLVPRKEFEETRFYHEWCAPQGITGAIASVLDRTQSTSAFLNIRWHEADGELDDGALNRTALLIPHFQRAVAIGRLFDQRKARERALVDTLHGVDAGIYLLDPTGRILFSNDAGSKVLDEARLLRRQGDRLVASDADAALALQEIVAASARGDAEAASRGVSISLSADGWLAYVLPLAAGERLVDASISEAVAAVFLRRTTAFSPTPLEELAAKFKLTASELRVLDAVMKASGVAAIAEMLGISQATTKTHLQNLFRKTDTHRQGDLVKLVAGFRD